ncbi:MAG TPA: TPM domain-containing protein [Candidatus Dojkabacteria bacterium]|nr:TPM domain-containing protein [Candidatus Dojkabacteria bacterium]
MKIKNIVISFVLLLLFATPVIAYYDLGSPEGYVNDYTNTLTYEQKDALESKVSTFEQESTNEIAVVIIDSMKGDYIENFAVKLFESWGIGKEKEDNGVLILVSMSERQMRIEVGYGLEGSLTDAQASWIIKNVMAPNFKENKYYEGIDQSVDKIIAITKGEFEVPEEDSISPLTVLVFIVILILGVAIAVIILKKKYPNWEGWDTDSSSSSSFGGWGGGSDSSSGSFGGGSSGGGGASGSW